MWIPKSEQQIKDRLNAGDLTETEVFDLKRELPGSNKNVDLAVDIAAMANDGGVLLYGLGREEPGRPIELHPIDDMEGQEERVAQIARSSIGGNLQFRIRQVRSKDDVTRGYLVVEVPASPNAPHMVLPKKRFYGRLGTTNVELGQGEVDRLYERRKRWEVNHERLLNEAVNRRPLELKDGLGHLYVIAHPVGSDDGVLDRALEAASEAGPGTGDPLLYLREAGKVCQEHGKPSIQSLVQFVHTNQGRAASTAIDSSPDLTEIKARRALKLEVARDGGMYFFQGRAAEQYRDPSFSGLMLFEEMIASQTAIVLAFAGRVLRAGGHHGSVDLGVVLNGIKGAYPWRFANLPPAIRFDERQYRKATRRPSADLLQELPSVLRDLLDPLFQVVSQGRRDPIGSLFATPSPS